MTTTLLLATLLAAAPSAQAGTSARITGGYFGDFLTHPGGYAGMSWPLAEAGAFEVSSGFEVGAYHHQRNHTGAFARGHLSNRISAASGAFVEPRFVAGYLHTFVDADEYWMVDENTGAIRQSIPGGSPNITYGFGVGGGWAPPSGKAPTLVLRIEALGRAPYNGFTLSQFAAQAGIEWSLGGGAR